MKREEAIKEIEKAFEPAFANYIITALTEGATVSDKDSTTKNDIRDNRVKNELNRVKDELEPTTKSRNTEREVLDEIRAEIEEQVLESLSDGGDDWFTAEKVNECLEIIDKYKAGSEVKE